MSVSRIHTAAILAAITGIILPASAMAQNWNYKIEPYVMATSIKGDASMGRVSGVAVDVGFSDILETLDAAAMIHFEAENDNGWGLALDYGFMNLKADITGNRGGVIDASVKQGVLEALVIKSNKYSGGSLDFFGGVRWWDNQIKALVDPAILPGSFAPRVNEDWLDAVFGLRLESQINDKWDFTFRGDIGGLGLESDFTSTIAAGLLYQMSQNWTLDLQYKATWVDYENGRKDAPGYFAYDTVTHGPLIGAIFSF